MTSSVVLLVGRQRHIADHVAQQLGMPDIEVLGASNPDEVRALLTSRPVAHVFIGPGLSPAERLDVVASILNTGDTTSVHLKDARRGPEGALDFVRGILIGLAAHYSR